MIKKVGLAAIFTIAIGWAHLPVADELVSNLKLASLYQLTHFIKWPYLKDNRINLCSAHSFNGKIQFFEGKLSEQRLIKVIEHPDDISLCQIYLINSNKLPRAIPENLAILTISGQQGFIKNGGMLEIRLIDQRIRFFLDYKQVKNRNIQVSSKLLQLMKIVE